MEPHSRLLAAIRYVWIGEKKTPGSNCRRAVEKVTYRDGRGRPCEPRDVERLFSSYAAQSARIDHVNFIVDSLNAFTFKVSPQAKR